MKFETAIYDDDDNEIMVDVEYDAYYLPAKVSGPPENCYPEESEMNINSVKDGDGHEVALSERQMEQIIDEAWEQYHDKMR